MQCWGGNFAGQVGDGTTADRFTPTPVTGFGTGAAAVAAGYYHTCGRTVGGEVQCWGGDGTTLPVYGPTPVPVAGLASDVTLMAAGRTHTCVVTSGAGMLCWGGNVHGELGDGTTTDRIAPTPVSGMASGVLAITAGEWHTCALTIGGGVHVLG